MHIHHNVFVWEGWLKVFLVQHDVAKASHDLIPKFHERQKALPRKPLQTGLQLRRSAGLTPGERVAAGRERDGKAKGTSHTGREGGGRRKQNEVAHSKTCLADNSGRTHHDMMTNFCGSQESTAAGRHPRLVIQKPPFDILYASQKQHIGKFPL